MTHSLKDVSQHGALAKCNAREELDSGNLNNELVNVPLTPLICCGKWEPMCICLSMCCCSVCPSSQLQDLFLGYENAIDIKKMSKALYSGRHDFHYHKKYRDYIILPNID